MSASPKCAVCGTLINLHGNEANCVVAYSGVFVWTCCKAHLDVFYLDPELYLPNMKSFYNGTLDETKQGS